MLKALFLLLILPALAAAAPGDRRVVDDFEDVSGWSSNPADGVKLGISRGEGVHGGALKLDVDFVRGGGYAVAHKAFDVPLPANYRFHFSVRGDIAPEDLEFKLIDSTGANVWWMNRRMFTFPARWDSLTTKKRQIEFAWGPLGGGDLKQIAAIEFAITAGSGGKGTVWIDDMTLEEMPPADAPLPKPAATASSAAPGHEAFRAIDGDSQTSWRPAPDADEPSWTVDYGVVREFSAALLEWEPNSTPASYVLERSDDGAHWRSFRTIDGARPRRAWIYTPDAEARYLRVRILKGPASLAGMRLEKPEWAKNANEFFGHIASNTRHGIYPRGMSGEQPYWTIVGSDRSPHEALVDEDGRIEPWKAGPALEPFLLLDRQGLVTWYDAPRKTQELVAEYFPRVTWRRPESTLEITASVNDEDELLARYLVRNVGKVRLKGSLVVAVRPFQVNPPAQFLNTTGGVAPIRKVLADDALGLDDRPKIESIPKPSFVGAASFDDGDLVADFLARGVLPGRKQVDDPTGFAAAAMQFPFDLVPGDSALFLLTTRLSKDGTFHRGPIEPRTEVVLEGPRPARDAIRTLYAQLHYARVTRDSVALMPGARSYERSWIRDGALSSSAFLRMGQPEVAKNFVRWFANYVPDDGAVPCCIDRRGADPTPEHDSHGEFIFLVSEILRYTGDIDLARELWPAVRRTADHIVALTAQRKTREYSNTEFYGLLPPSISHEGYSAKPMHSYWDDFFAYRGLFDAAWLACRLDHRDDCQRFDDLAGSFYGDLSSSIERAMKKHGIHYVPGCADLGDFDATSTTIVLDPTNTTNLVGDANLRATFDLYWKNFIARRDGPQTWNDYTPYEVRTIGALVRLGERERANQALAYFLKDRRPAGFLDWAEVVGRDKRKPRFIGDMPHTWVGTDYVRSVVDMFAYTHVWGDSVLAIGAGLPRAWVAQEQGVRVANLPTPFGDLAYRMYVRNGVTMCDIEALASPPGRVAIAPPAPAGKAWTTATINGKVRKYDEGGLWVQDLPAHVEFR